MHPRDTGLTRVEVSQHTVHSNSTKYSTLCIQLGMESMFWCRLYSRMCRLGMGHTFLCRSYSCMCQLGMGSMCCCRLYSRRCQLGTGSMFWRHLYSRKCLSHRHHTALHQSRTRSPNCRHTHPPPHYLPASRCVHRSLRTSTRLQLRRYRADTCYKQHW